MERHVEAMTGKELAEEFKIMVHNFVHMGELPHERVSWAVGLVGPDGGEWAEAYQEVRETATFWQFGHLVKVSITEPESCCLMAAAPECSKDS